MTRIDNTSNSSVTYASGVGEPYFLGGVKLVNPTFISSHNNITSATNTAASNGSAPTGKRIALLGYTVHNTSVNSLTFDIRYLAISGYPIVAPVTVAPGATVSGPIGFIGSGSSPADGTGTQLSSGSIRIVTSGTFAGGSLIVTLNMVTFDSTTPLKCSRRAHSSFSANTASSIYTVPTGKSAVLLDRYFRPAGGGIGVVNHGNANNGSTTVDTYLVANGGSPDTSTFTNRAATGTTAAGNTTAQVQDQQVTSTLAAGESVQCVLSNVGSPQIVWVMYAEY